MPCKPSYPILHQIRDLKKILTGDALKDLKKAAKNLNVAQDSLIWLITDVFPSGHMRSRAFCDAPYCVVDDGLIEEKLGSGLNYIPWQFTAKAIDIFERMKQHGK